MSRINLTSAQALLRPVLHWARLLFTPLALLVIAWLIWQSSHAVIGILHQATWSLLMVALLLWLVTNFLSPLVTVYLFRTCGMQIDYKSTIQIHCKRLPAKYLPGGIWHSLGRANDYYKLGHNAKKIGVYFILENFLLVAVTLSMSAVIVHKLIEPPVLKTFLYFLPILMGIALVLFPLIARKFIKNTVSFSTLSYVAAIACLILYWCIVGLTFACFISAFNELGLSSSLIDMAGIYIFSWSLGYLALFAPQGIGVSEFIASNLLSNGSQAGQLVVFLVGFRLLVLFSDMCSWLIVGILKPRR